MRALQFALCFASHQRTVCFEVSFAFALTPNIVVVSFPADFVVARMYRCFTQTQNSPSHITIVLVAQIH